MISDQSVRNPQMASRSLWFAKPRSVVKSDLLLCRGKEGEGKGFNSTGQAWAGQVDGDCSPTSHPWTLTLIERSMKYRWSLWWPPSHAPSPLHYSSVCLLEWLEIKIACRRRVGMHMPRCTLGVSGTVQWTWSVSPVGQCAFVGKRLKWMYVIIRTWEKEREGFMCFYVCGLAWFSVFFLSWSRRWMSREIREKSKTKSPLLLGFYCCVEVVVALFFSF